LSPQDLAYFREHYGEEAYRRYLARQQGIGAAEPAYGPMSIPEMVDSVVDEDIALNLRRILTSSNPDATPAHDIEPPTPGMARFWYHPAVRWIPLPIRLVMAGVVEPLLFQLAMPLLNPKLLNAEAAAEAFVNAHGKEQTEREIELRRDL